MKKFYEEAEITVTRFEFEAIMDGEDGGDINLSGQ